MVDLWETRILTFSKILVAGIEIAMAEVSGIFGGGFVKISNFRSHFGSRSRARDAFNSFHINILVLRPGHGDGWSKSQL